MSVEPSSFKLWAKMSLNDNSSTRSGFFSCGGMCPTSKLSADKDGNLPTPLSTSASEKFTFHMSVVSIDTIFIPLFNKMGWADAFTAKTLTILMHVMEAYRDKKKKRPHYWIYPLVSVIISSEASPSLSRINNQVCECGGIVLFVAILPHDLALQGAPWSGRSMGSAGRLSIPCLVSISSQQSPHNGNTVA